MPNYKFYSRCMATCVTRQQPISSAISHPQGRDFAPLFKHGVRMIFGLIHSCSVARAFVSGAGENRDRNCGETPSDGLGDYQLAAIQR